MSTLTCFTSSYCYKSYSIASGDVADVITSIRAELLARNNPAWTEPSGNLFKSPVDAAGRYLDMLFTRIDQGTLEMRVRDQLARTICTRRIQPGTSPFVINIFSGQFHFILDAMNPAGANTSLYAGILDQTPDAQGSNPLYVYGGGYLSNTNTNDGYSSVSRFFMYDSSGAAWADRAPVYGSSYSQACLYNQNGAKIYKPAETYVQTATSVFKVVGRKYQQLYCTSDLNQMARVTVPLDNMSGLFQVTCISAALGMRLACRIG